MIILLIQRKDYSCLTKYLPPRLEYVLKIRLSDVQCQLYRAFLQYRVDRGLTSTVEEQRNTLFRDQQALYRVWTHPYTLKMHETREARRVSALPLNLLNSFSILLLDVYGSCLRNHNE